MATASKDFIRELERVMNDARDLVTVESQLQHALEDLASEQAARASDMKVLTAQITARDNTITALKAEVDRLTKPPVKPLPKMLYGACPDRNGTSNTTVEDQIRAVQKFGQRGTVRQFLGTGVAPRAPQDIVIRVHVSWNLGSMTLEDLTPAWVTRVTANLLPGDRVEVIHEADKKVTDGKRTYEECVAFKNRFFDLITVNRPDLRVVNTLTGGSLSSYGGDREERWGAVKADLLGVDCDGVHDTSAPLNISYRDEMVNAKAFVEKYAANGYRGIIVPEFGTSRPSYDATGEIRAGWVVEQDAIFREFGVEEVNLYDYESTKGNEFAPGSPEHGLWSAFFAEQAP